MVKLLEESRNGMLVPAPLFGLWECLSPWFTTRTGATGGLREGAKFIETRARHSGSGAVTFFNTVNHGALTYFHLEIHGA